MGELALSVRVATGRGNRIEHFFSKLKHFRPVATHYDKLAKDFIAMIQFASMCLWLCVYASTEWTVWRLPPSPYSQA